MKFAICDIDRTIANNDRRKYQSALDVARRNLDYKYVIFGGYGISHVFNSKEDIDNFLQIFLSEKYLYLDEPLPHSPQILRKIVSFSGLIYLTGRHHSQQGSMREKTIIWLKKHSYPVPNDINIYLFMKPDRHMSDEDHKKIIIPRILEMGEISCGIGDTPNDGKIYSEFSIRPVLLTTPHFKRSDLFNSGKDVIVVDDWYEMEDVLLELLRT